MDARFDQLPGTISQDEIIRIHAAKTEKFIHDPRLAGSVILSREAARMLAWCEIIQDALGPMEFLP